MAKLLVIIINCALLVILNNIFIEQQGDQAIIYLATPFLAILRTYIYTKVNIGHTKQSLSLT